MNDGQWLQTTLNYILDSIFAKNKNLGCKKVNGHLDKIRLLLVTDLS